MKSRELAWIPVVLIYVNTAFGQVSLPNNLPYKDLIFPQLAAGGGYETWITVTNRGTETWNGTFRFFHNKGEAWNPIINGISVSGGALRVSIQPKQTNTYKVSLSSLASGFVIATADDTQLTSFLEGNLTYYVTQGGATIDSVGVQPSRPLLSASLPFEDFGAICMAFANTDAEGRLANIKFKVFSSNGVQQGTTKVWPNMAAREHKAQYLFELFPEIPKAFGRGRLEIESDVPISGMALTLVSQMSSLPLNSTTRTYEVNSYGGVGGINIKRLTLFPEGLFINGYATIENQGVSDLYPIFGNIRDGKALMHFEIHGDSSGELMLGYIIPAGSYQPDSMQFVAEYYIIDLKDEYVLAGALEATLIQ